MNRWLEIAKDAVGGRKWLVALDVAVPGTLWARKLRELGAADVFVVAATRGVGDLTEQPEDRLVVMDAHRDGFMENIRAAEALMDDLPAEVRARIDAWDPERAALAIRPHFSGARPVADRRTWGARAEAWQALEDKTVIDAVWDAAQVARAPCEVVPVAEAPDAAARIDEGGGCVWAGDSREGFNGGASYTRWVRTEASRDEALAFFGERCDRVRVMPFLAGVPCSVHGMVLPGEEHVIALRPMEMVVLRQQERFVYCGAARSWRPAGAVREEMRAVARRVGHHLREVYAYRGAYTVDGVVTAEGFRPTELNPRFGAAMFYFDFEDLPLRFLINSVVDGAPYRWDAPALEEELMRRSAEPGGSGGGIPLPTPCEGRRELGLVHEAGWREAREDEEPHVSLQQGPWGSGSLCRVRFPAEHLPVGPPLAPRLAEVLRFMSPRWQLGLEGVEGG